MKIKDSKVKDVLNKVILDLESAKKYSYNTEEVSRREIDSAKARINTLLTLIDFDEE